MEEKGVWGFFFGCFLVGFFFLVLFQKEKRFSINLITAGLLELCFHYQTRN